MAPPIVSRLRQFLAVLHKNVMLQTRMGGPKLPAFFLTTVITGVFRACFGLLGACFAKVLTVASSSRGRKLKLPVFGIAGALLNVCIPALFFLVMWMPKYFIPVFPLPFVQFPNASIDTNWIENPYRWGSDPYEGPAYQRQSTARVIFTPNTTEVQRIVELVAKSVACPRDIQQCIPKGAAIPCFQSLFVDEWNASCLRYEFCVSTPACWSPLIGQELLVMGSEDEAVELALAKAKLGLPVIDSIVAFQDAKLLQYKIRMNHTDTPDARKLFHKFAISPADPTPPNPLRQLKNYWFFVNLQLVIDRALLGSMHGNGSRPADVYVSLEPFPWPKKSLDIAGVLAAFAFNLLIVFAFMAPSRGVVATIVREKELRLREGMRILGLKDVAYWSSWALTHWFTLALSSVACTLVGLYPFARSNPLLLLSFLLVFSASLISYSYFISTLFSQSRVAGSASMFLYALSMLPGFIVPSVYDYGGPSWYWACLLPPSAASMFASALMKLEGSAQGLTMATVGQPLVDQVPFSTASIYLMLLADIGVFALLTWYFDKVMPGVGQQQPPWFPLMPSYWIDRSRLRAAKLAHRMAHASEQLQPLLPGAHRRDVEDGEGFAAEEDSAGVVAVEVEKLRKVFRATDGSLKVAVDDLSLSFERGKISALLGHNGAGKTTTIHMLIGMLQPTSGQALIGGLSIWRDMSAIRRSLGVCPQFDILWPDITVREHLELYAVIKGVEADKVAEVVEAAVREVDLEEKMDFAAGELSGGQRRKLSVAIAFMGSPEVVFLDEPTSGMDPYSRRFTWEVIRRRRHNTAIILTTHSMEEADILCDHITIMADGRVAARGTPLELKRQYGVGYTLTLVQEQATAAAGAHVPEATRSRGGHPAVEALVGAHVSGAQLLSSAGAEIAFRLPSEESGAFGALLRELEARKGELGVSSYGLGMTTLEEVFLTVAAATAEAHEQPRPHRTASDAIDTPTSFGVVSGGPRGASPAASVTADLEEERQREQLTGVWLFLSQFRALLTKRALSARRDRLAVLTQLVVPLALVWLALWVCNLSVRNSSAPALQLTRGVAMAGQPAAWMAPPDVRINSSSSLSAFLDAYGREALYDSGATKSVPVPKAWQKPGNGTLEFFILQHWNTRHSMYDGLAIQALPSPQDLAAGAPARFVIFVNESAVAALPAAASQLTSALMRYMAPAGDSALPHLLVENHPLPVLHDEASVQMKQEGAMLVLVMCLSMACAVLSASFVVFLVREVEAGSKHVQMVSGAPPAAMWTANYLWDLASFLLPAAGILALFLYYRLPQFLGARLAAVMLLLIIFALAALPLTYLLSFSFKDEMKALQRLNMLYSLVGILGFFTTFIMDIIVSAINPRNLRRTDHWFTATLRLLSPHFCFVRGVFDVSQTYNRLLPIPGMKPATDPFDRTVFWDAAGHMMVQAVVYSTLVLMMEYGVLRTLWHRLFTKGASQTFWQQRGESNHRPEAPVEVALPRSSSQQRVETSTTPQDPAVSTELLSSPLLGGGVPQAATEGEPLLGGEGEEDVDVRAERLLVQSGSVTAGAQVLLQGVVKSYSQGALEAPLMAVKGLWTAIPPAECFGLLGVNGAGKTTTFKMLTGEVAPDSGDALVGHHSVLTELALARRCMGYCPQFDGLPQALTGREVLTMFARLRGVPERRIPPMVSLLLSRLGLTSYANSECSTYSGGNRRKLGVGVALVGHPAVVMLDEPSTGMDPAARRALWSLLQHEVAVEGRSVVLTSHSMEECEALCSRIAIMVAGSFRCMGTVQHLKSRFGGGYSLELKLEGGEAAAAAVKAHVVAMCPSASLVEEQPGRMLYTIGREGLDLPGLFEAVEACKGSLGVTDYALTQTTLEQVFIALAHGQHQLTIANGQ